MLVNGRGAARLIMPLWLALMVLAAISFALLSIGLDRHSLVFDDGYSLWFSDDLGILLDRVYGTGGNMALYYVMLWVWRLAGASDEWLRLLSMLWAVAGTVLAARLCARLTTERLAWVAGLWLATNPFLATLALEVRGYTLLYFLGTLLVYALLRHLENGSRGWLFLALLAALGAVSTHYFAIILILALSAWAIVEYLIERRQQRLGVLLTLALALVMGLLYFVVLSGDGHGNLSFLTNWSFLIVPQFLWVMNGSELLNLSFAFAVITGLLVAMLMYRVWRAGADPTHSLQRLLVLWIGLPFFAFVLISELMQPIYKDRYLIWLLPAFAALVPALAGRARSEPRWLALLLLMCVSNIAVMIGHYERGSSEDWREAAAIVARETSDDEQVPLLFYIYDGRFVFDAYAHRSPNLSSRLDYPEFRGELTTRVDPRVPEPDWKALAEIAREHRSLWLVTTHISPDRSEALQRAIEWLVGDDADRGTWEERPVELAHVREMLEKTHGMPRRWPVPGVVLWHFEKDVNASR